MDCIFCKIASKEIPKEFTYVTENVVVFPDIHPIATLHLLIVSKKHIKEFAALENGEQPIWEEMMEVLQQLIKKYKLREKGYRLVINGGGAQLVDHLHIHLMGNINKERGL